MLYMCKRKKKEMIRNGCDLVIRKKGVCWPINCFVLVCNKLFLDLGVGADYKSWSVPINSKPPWTGLIYYQLVHSYLIQIWCSYSRMMASLSRM